MGDRKKITISQNIATSTLGRAPIAEPFEYYLDVNGLRLEEALAYIRVNRARFYSLDVELTEFGDLEPEQLGEIGEALARDTIQRIHDALPARLGFSSQFVESLVGVEGKHLECFGMTLVEVAR